MKDAGQHIVGVHRLGWRCDARRRPIVENIVVLFRATRAKGRLHLFTALGRRSTAVDIPGWGGGRPEGDLFRAVVDVQTVVDDTWTYEVCRVRL